MTEMQLSFNGFSFIKQCEGCSLEAYQDVGGVWTIGYGWTNKVDGLSIKKGMVITQRTADNLLLNGLKAYVFGVNRLLKININQHQFDALVDFCYNIGIEAFSKSTLLHLVNDGCFSLAAEEFLKWSYVNGKKCAGLLNRRIKEQNLFLQIGNP